MTTFTRDAGPPPRRCRYRRSMVNDDAQRPLQLARDAARCGPTRRHGRTWRRVRSGVLARGGPRPAGAGRAEGLVLDGPSPKPVRSKSARSMSSLRVGSGLAAGPPRGSPANARGSAPRDWAMRRQAPWGLRSRSRYLQSGRPRPMSVEARSAGSRIGVIRMGRGAPP